MTTQTLTNHHIYDDQGRRGAENLARAERTNPKTWADVKAGDRLRIEGRSYDVLEALPSHNGVVFLTVRRYRAMYRRAMAHMEVGPNWWVG